MTCKHGFPAPNEMTWAGSKPPRCAECEIESLATKLKEYREQLARAENVIRLARKVDWRHVLRETPEIIKWKYRHWKGFNEFSSALSKYRIKKALQSYQQGKDDE